MKCLIEIESIDTLVWMHSHKIKGFCINMGHRFYTISSWAKLIMKTDMNPHDSGHVGLVFLDNSPQNVRSM